MANVFKTIFTGALVGAIAFFMPGIFLFFLAFMLLAKFLFMGMWAGRWNHSHYRWAMADKLRSMSDEEYREFREKYNSCCGYHPQNKEEKMQ
jgi:uncharacterized transporter YbjL